MTTLTESGLIMLEPPVYDGRFDIESATICPCWCIHCQQWVPRLYPEEHYRNDRCPKCKRFGIYSDPFVVKKIIHKIPISPAIKLELSTEKEPEMTKYVSVIDANTLPYSEAAKRVGIHSTTVRRYVARGYLPGYEGGRVRMEDLMKVMAERGDKVTDYQSRNRKRLANAAQMSSQKTFKVLSDRTVLSTWMPINDAAHHFGILKGKLYQATMVAGKVKYEMRDGRIFVDTNDTRSLKSRIDMFDSEYITLADMGRSLGVRSGVIRQAAQNVGAKMDSYTPNTPLAILKSDRPKVEARVKEITGGQIQPVAKTAKTVPERTTAKAPAKTTAKAQGRAETILAMLPARVRGAVSILGDGGLDPDKIQRLSDVAMEPYKTELKTLAQFVRTFGK